MEREKPSYYSIIPANVRYDSELTSNAKLLYGEITSLANKNGSCWASNSYFASLYSVSNRTIINWVNSLKDAGYIDIQLIRKNNSKEVEKRLITLNEVVKKTSLPPRKKLHTPSEKNFTENNTSINNTSNNNKPYVELDSTVESNPPYSEIIDYLNQKTGSNLRSTTKAYQRLINGRWSEKYTLEDFKKVIDNKCSEWIGTNFEKHLVPKTLFAPSHFDDYLNQKITKPNSASGYDETKFEKLPY